MTLRHSEMTRRRLLLASLALPAWPLLNGCSAPIPRMRGAVTTSAAAALLARSAAAHGGQALATLSDLNVAYSGRWHPLVGKLQPALVDAGFRGGSEERLLPGRQLLAQAHTGPLGRKYVARRWRRGSPGEVRVWVNREESHDADRLAAAALVADGYALFLLGPMLLAQTWGTDRTRAMELEGVQRIEQRGVRHECDVLSVQLTPGLGLSAGDRCLLFIDREEHVMRKVRFTLDGLASTRGAIAEVDTEEYVALHGVRWPTRFHEQLLRPFPLAVHDWRLTGLDVNRGLTPADIDGTEFSGGATRAATPLPM